MNFALGFFGYPFDGQYQQSITIEANGVRLFLCYIRIHLCITNTNGSPH